MSGGSTRAYFGQVPLWLVGRVSSRAVEVYVTLHGVWASRDSDGDITCWPSRKSIATRLYSKKGEAVSERTVDRAIQELENVGAIRTSHHFGEHDGGSFSGSETRQTSNLFHLAFEQPFEPSKPPIRQKRRRGTVKNVTGVQDKNAAAPRDKNVAPELEPEEPEPEELERVCVQKETAGIKEQGSNGAQRGKVRKDLVGELVERGEKRLDLVTVEFDEQFWPAFPKERRVAKKQALTAYRSARKRTDAETIVDALTAAVAFWKDERRPASKIPHAATWLNGDRWEDETASTGKSLSVYDIGIVKA